METTRNKSDEDLGVSSIRHIWRDIINIRSHFNTSDCLTALCFGLGKICDRPFDNCSQLLVSPPVKPFWGIVEDQ